jgi:DNA topoisomerase IA
MIFLVINFPDILDVEFTAQMEENLDKIEEGEKGWLDALKEFYAPSRRITIQSKRDTSTDLCRTWRNIGCRI